MMINLLGKFLVEVDTTVDLSATRAWLPMHSEQPGISVRAPTCEHSDRHSLSESWR